MAHITKSSFLKLLSVALLSVITGAHLIGFIGQRHAVPVHDRSRNGELDRLKRQREIHIAGLESEKKIRSEKKKPFSGQVLPGSGVEKLPEVIGRLPDERKVQDYFDNVDQESKGNPGVEPAPARPQNEKAPTGHTGLFQFSRPGYFTVQEILGIEFPPVGEPGPSYEASMYYPLQKRFSPVEVHSMKTAEGLVLYGAALCEEVHGEDVVLTPCIFRETLPRVSQGSASLFSELANGVQYTQSLAFLPWSRYATSHMGCAAGGQYRITVQFGDTPTERFVSVRVPYSSSEENALLDLNSAARKPCMGLDLFFTPEYMLRMMQDVEKHRFSRIDAQPGPAAMEGYLSGQWD